MLKITTKEDVKTRAFTKEQLRHLHFLLQPYWVPFDYEGDTPSWMDSDYQSYISFAYRDPTDADKSSFHGYAGCLKTDDSDDGFDSFYSPIPAVDLYCCPNGLKSLSFDPSNPYVKRTNSSLISLQTIVIDIDAHNSTLSIDDLQSHIKDFVPKLLDNVFFRPNFISYTGRGVHFWYCLEPCHVSLSGTVSDCLKGLLSCYKAAMASIGESVLSIDDGASKKLTGLFRVPYSYNSKAHTWATGELLHYERIHVNTLIGALQSLGYSDNDFGFAHKDIEKSEPKNDTPKTTKKSKHPKKPGFKYKTVSQYRGAFIHRKAFVEYLFNSRDTVIGQRHTLFYMLAHAVYNLSDSFDDTYSYMLYVNSTLSESMLDSEIKAITTYVYNHNWKITNDKFLEFCNATDAEVNYFNRSTEKKKQKAAAAKKKLDRDSKIYELWDSGCTNVSEIARVVGCNRRTVYKVISYVRF